MQAGEQLSLEQIRAFLEASEGVGFKGRNREEVYEWVNQTLREQLPGSEAQRTGTGAALRVEDDGAEPGAEHSSADVPTGEVRR